MTSNTLKIIAEPNVIDDHLLDIIGNGFNFDHEKGLAEWLKNSVDAYIRKGTPDNDQFIVLRFKDGKAKNAVFECVDFVGMNELDIEKAFKRWGDPEAAKRGLNKRVYGGHGNGGKFFMRQMFEQSYFITYKEGKLNIFGFNKDKKYGFADGFKSKKIIPAKALEMAGIDDLEFPQNTKQLIMDGKSGFTVVRGVGPVRMKNLIKFDKITDKLKNHPQVRRILEHISVFVNHNDFPDYVLLKPEEIKPLKGFEEVKVIEIPETISGEEEMLEMSNKKYGSGRLILRTSEEALGKGSSAGDLNRIDIVGEIGVIASYQLYELGVRVFPQASFIYGECECPILEDPEMDAVNNDRSKLVETPRSTALLKWIAEQIDDYANKIAAAERKDQEIMKQKISVAYNDFLNKWKDRFMNRLLGDLFNPGGEGGGEGGEGGTKKNNLQAPKDGFEFSFPEAEILVNKEEKITVKATIPDPVPLGSIIRISSSNALTECLEPKLIVKADDVKIAQGGESVAVLNLFVIGRQADTEAILTATVGKLKTEIKLKTVGAKAGDTTKKPKSPRVLLSGYDQDPLNIAPGGIVTLTERQPLIFQRHQDVPEGIYWINTQSPLARAILEKYDDSSPRWRDYLFQRYVDIFVKEALHQLQKREPENFKADRVDQDIDDLTRKVHATALADLSSFFFEEEFKPLVDKK